MTGAWFSRTFLTLSMLLLLCIHGDARVAAKASDCHPTARLPQERTRRTFTMEPLAIYCIINSCGEELKVSWCKLDPMQDCLDIKETAHVSSQMEATAEEVSEKRLYLHFTQTFLNDSGKYRCTIFGRITVVSHFVHVIVTEAQSDGNFSSAINTTSAPVQGDDVWPQLQSWLPQIYISAGILTFLIAVMGGVFFTLQKNKSQYLFLCLQHNAVENSCQAAGSHNLPVQPRSVHVHPARHVGHGSGVDDNVPTGIMSQTKCTKAPVRAQAKQPEAPNVEIPLVNTESFYDNDGAIEKSEQSGVLYASLNHQLACEGHSPLHSSLPREDFSEYSLIRVS
ncbi:B- and T-lymphocyte attenuator isoform X1 [Arapaima gigas]